MDFHKRLAKEALKSVDTGYKSPILPGCAYFVSEMMKRAGWPGPSPENPGWVPSIALLGKIVKIPKIGDLIIFERTYIAPGGDDHTHIGIVIKVISEYSPFLRENSYDVIFIHFSTSKKRPIKGYSDDKYWREHFQEFRRLPEPSPLPPSPAGCAQFKLFYHPGVSLPNAIVNGSKCKVMECFLSVKTSDENKVLLNSQAFQKNPSICINGKYCPVKSIEMTIKYEEDDENGTVL